MTLHDTAYMSLIIYVSFNKGLFSQIPREKSLLLMRHIIAFSDNKVSYYLKHT